MRILYCGERQGNSLSRFESMQRLGHITHLFDPFDYLMTVPRVWRSIEYRLRNGPLIYLMNCALRTCALNVMPDVVWVEKGMTIYSATLADIVRETHCVLVGSHSDDFLDSTTNKVSRHFNSAIPLYDIIFTPRDINFHELYDRGAKRVEKFWKGYAESNIKPWDLSQDEVDRFTCDVMFVGHCEEFRFGCLFYLVEKDINLRVGGSGWDRFWPNKLPIKHIGKVEGIDFAKAYCAAKIGITFLSRWNRDTQNSRAFEIPATKTFMLAERSPDMEKCFVEGVEAEFFSSKEELFDKICYYLSHKEKRIAVAMKGYERSIKSGYSNFHRTQNMLDIVDRCHVARRQSILNH